MELNIVGIINMEKSMEKEFFNGLTVLNIQETFLIIIMKVMVHSPRKVIFF